MVLEQRNFVAELSFQTSNFCGFLAELYSSILCILHHLIYRERHQKLFVPPDVILLHLSFPSSVSERWMEQTWSFHQGNNTKFWWDCLQTLWKETEIRYGHLPGIAKSINFSSLPLFSRNVNHFYYNHFTGRTQNNQSHLHFTVGWRVGHQRSWTS